MANRDTPFGFKPLRGPFCAHKYLLTTANVAIGVGDVIVRNASGMHDRGAASATQIVGIALESAAANDGANGKEILVSDDPNTVYLAQMDDGVSVGALQDGMTLNFDFVATAPSNGLSRMELNESSANTTATLPFKALRLHKAVDNAFGEFQKTEVKINAYAFAGDKLGV